MNYVFLLLLFVTSPNSIKDADKGTKKDTRIWSLQTAVSMEVSSHEWCSDLADSIDGSISTTATVTTRIFCIPKDEKDLVASLTKLYPQEKDLQGLQSLSKFKEQSKITVPLQQQILQQITVGPNKPK